jgi:hypothetical protein
MNQYKPDSGYNNLVPNFLYPNNPTQPTPEIWVTRHPRMRRSRHARARRQRHSRRSRNRRPRPCKQSFWGYYYGYYYGRYIIL